MGENSIYKKMLAITKEVATVAKNLEVGFGAGKYKAVGEADILRSVKPIEEKHGVYSYPYDREIIESGTMERETKNGKSIQLYLRIKTVYRFVSIEDCSYIDIVSYGDGVDTQDKSPGKAMTYADKYALMKAYKIQTGDDPDQNASEPQTAVKTTQDSQRKVMEDYVRKHYDAANLGKMLEYYKVASVSDLDNVQLATVYSRKLAQERGNA